jgi:hypothetical protein
MRKKLLLSLLLAYVFCLLSSQVPQGFNYQAIARNASGKEIVSTSLQVRISILTDTTGFYSTGSGTYVWEEQQNVTTNSFGLFTLIIGNPLATKVQGSAATFSAVNWNGGSLFLGAKVNYQGIWLNLGTSKLGSVPYAKVAGSFAGPLQKLAVKGAVLSPDSALFEVKNSSGQTVFAVYNEGIRAYVDNGLVKGATKGGFAIGGFGTAKAQSQTLMMISPDSARIYVDETAVKGTKGGFAIGGFNTAKGTLTEFMKMTPSNYFIGHKSGQSITTGVYNSTMGYESGKSLTTGTNNVLIGYQSGTAVIGGTSNVFIGSQAGFTTNTGGFNVFIGTQAGYTNSNGLYNIALGRQSGFLTTGSSNIFLGDLTAYFNSTGSQNVMIGDWAGYHNTLGAQNVFLGAEAGWNNTIGNYNNFIGFRSGNQNIDGSFNSFIGYQAGYNNTSGQYNTYLGYQAGYSGLTATGSNNIFMGVEAGYSNTVGHDNIALGNKAGRSNIDGIFNVMIGSSAGNMNTTGDYNTVVGYKAGQNTTSNYGTMLGYLAGNLTTAGNSQTMIGYMAGANNTGSYNTLFGVEAGGYSQTGSDNTYIGLAAGDYAAGSRNVFIGKWAGYGEATNSDKLIISNNYTGADNLNNALVYGDFAVKTFKVNGQILSSVNKSSGYAADFRNTGGLSTNYGVNISAGTADGSGTYNYLIDFNSGNGSWKGSILINNGAVQFYQASDSRLKENISKSSLNALKIINDLQVVDYNFTKSPGGKHTGYIAQDVEKVLPEMVIYNEKADIYAISPTTLIPILHKAIQEQQKEIEELKALVNSLIAAQAKSGTPLK